MRKVSESEFHSIEAAHIYGLFVESREIFISGEVDEDGILSSSLITNLRLLTHRSIEEPIVIHQHSLGGDWCSGVSMFDALLMCEAPIVFVCHGIAASMGSIIPLSCIDKENSYVVCMPNCDWLIHGGTTGISPDLTHRQSQSWSEWEHRLYGFMLERYAEACKNSEIHGSKTDRQIKSYIRSRLSAKEDWWLSAREAVDHGFAHGILGEEGYETINSIKEQI